MAPRGHSEGSERNVYAVLSLEEEEGEVGEEEEEVVVVEVGGG